MWVAIDVTVHEKGAKSRPNLAQEVRKGLFLHVAISGSNYHILLKRLRREALLPHAVECGSQSDQRTVACGERVIHTE